MSLNVLCVSNIVQDFNPENLETTSVEYKVV